MIPSFLSTRFSTTACAFLFMFCGTYLSAQDMENGEKIYQNCVACHGQEGHGNKLLNAPQIAGLDAVYLETQLKNFKYSVRGADPRVHAGL